MDLEETENCTMVTTSTSPSIDFETSKKKSWASRTVRVPLTGSRMRFWKQSHKGMAALVDIIVLLKQLRLCLHRGTNQREDLEGDVNQA